MENTNAKKLIYIILGLIVVLVVVVLVTRNKKQKDGEGLAEYDTFPANVESIDVLLQESFPVMVNVLAKGYLPDGCSELGDVRQQLVGNTFKVNLEARKLKDSDVMCTQVIQNFEKNIVLENVVGISVGEYVVDVNGIQKTFFMDVDNYISNVDPLK